MKQEKKRKLNNWIMAILMLILSFSTCSCSGKKADEAEQDNPVSMESQDVQKYVEEHYGIADNPVYGSRIAHTETEMGTTTTTYNEKIKEDSKGGSVFCKTVTPKGQTDGVVCVYLADEEGRGIYLKTDYIYSKNDFSSSVQTITLTTTSEKNRCYNIVDYAIVSNDYLACVELSEQKDITDDDLKVYCEEISVYKLTGSGLDELHRIRRELESGTNKLKTFDLKTDSERVVYAAGYRNYTAEGAEFVSTQQEFCDRANELLKSCSLDYITLNKTSWNNRWFGMNINESKINDSMVKVDFASAESIVDENGDEITDIVIEINAEKQKLEKGEKLEEIEDYPVTYSQNTETITENPVVMPENIPQSIDINELQDLRYFDIDGFWHSSDYRYVYYIYTQHPDNGFGILYFADLKGRSKAKHGQVKQTSSYSVILKAMEDDGFSPEVFASNNQLVSNEITLIKTDGWISSSLIGSWSDNSKSYTFDSDGTYEVKTSDDWYWGRYFIIDESQIVLGEHHDDLKVYDYTLEGNSFILNDRAFLRQ